MPVLQTYNMSYQFDNGEMLFQSLSCSMTKPRVGIIGRNGVGKSLFAAILCGDIMPTSGKVTLPHSFGVYRQQLSQLPSGDLSIAQFLSKSHVLDALKQVEAGKFSAHLFDVIGDQWDLLERLTKQLDEMGLPQDPDFPCAQLSGGQLTQLQLWQLFESQVALLILDEPSNHLDTQTKQWLINSMRSFKGAILLISHDRELLNEQDEIWALSGLGLQVFGGNYSAYAEHKRLEKDALERQIASIDKQKRHLKRQAQRNREKAEQRAVQGKKLRQAGSQPKVMLDSMKDKATAGTASRNKNQQRRQTHLQDKENSLNKRKEQFNKQSLYLGSRQISSRKVISILDAILPFGSKAPINLQIYAHDKVHLIGNNGSGKSTLLKSLLGELTFLQGKLNLNTSLYYLDQHFSVICPERSILDNLMQLCEGMKENDARTLLAGIGFRQDGVFRLANRLSGGEMMKLAMLIASHQGTQPFLLLDEPDNHLDIDSKIMLAQALFKYPGGFILISHDADFAKESGVTQRFTL